MDNELIYPSVNILNLDSVLRPLTLLLPSEPPRFGIMTSQHMIEHLSFSVMFSNGKKPQRCAYAPEKAGKMKSYLIHTDGEYPMGFKTPVLTDELRPLVHKDLPSAIGSLESELGDFESYFHENPMARPINPALGELDYGEWVILHNKHFIHHYRQFGLV